LGAFRGIFFVLEFEMINFLTGTAALWGMTTLATAQTLAFVYQGNLPFALMFFGFVIADIGMIWSSK
jgi:hypothetical protein